MSYNLGKTYLIVITFTGKLLTFTGTITSETETHIFFTDKFGKNLSYRKADIISTEELTDDSQN